MEKGENELTHQQSLSIIEQMITAAKNEHREKGDGWLLWGWLLFIASLSSAILLAVGITGVIGWIWTGVLVVGFAIGGFLSATRKKRAEVTTYTQDFLNKIGVGFFISLFAMVAASYVTNAYYAFGYYYILYAFWMFIHGSAIRFRPLIVGAVINWLAAVAIFLTKQGDFLNMMIISSVAILCGYLIPGYMLRNQFKKSAQYNRERL